MEELIYNLCFFYRSSLFTIMEMQINDILILVNNNLANKKEVEIKAAKIMTKDQKYLTPTQPLKFNKVQIKLDLKSIILKKKVI